MAAAGQTVTNYKIQTFSVNFHVNQGDYIALKANKVGFMRHSGSGASIKFRPTAARSAAATRSADDDDDGLLIQFEYAS